MRIHYLYGRPGVGKTDRIYRELKEAPEGIPAFLLVPDQYTLRSEQDLCRRAVRNGLIDTTVLSFSRLAYRVFSEAGGLTLTRINEQGKQMVLRRVLDALTPDLTVFRYASGREGFVRNLSRLIGECKRFDIGAGALREAGSVSGGILGDKLTEIARIYEAFQAFMAGRYMDGEDAVDALLARMDDAPFLRHAHIWVDGFNAFTAQHLRIMGKLMALCDTMTIAMPMPFGADEDDLYREPARMNAHLHRLANEMGADEREEDMEASGAGDHRNRLSRFLAEQLYAYPYTPWEGEAEGLTLWYASNRREEIEHTAATIADLVREGTYRYRDIAVIAGAEESYQEPIRRIFAEYGIPVFIDARRPVRNHPLIQCVLSALSAIDTGFAYEPVFGYVKCGFTGLTWEQADGLENYCLRYGIHGSRWEKPFTIGGDECDLESLNACRARVAGPLVALRESLKDMPPADTAVAAIRTFLAMLDIEGQLQSWMEAMRARGWLEPADETAQIWDRLATVLAQMEGIMEDTPMGVAEALTLLETGVASLEVGVIPTTLDQVAVGSVKRSLARPAEVLFVLGVNDGVLPSAGADPGILSMAERSALTALGLDMPGDETMMAARERFGIHAIFAKAIVRLYVSCPLADETGATLRPSLLIDRLRELFPDMHLQNGLMTGDTGWIATPESALAHLIPRLRENAALPSPWRELYGWYSQSPGWRERYESVREGWAYENEARLDPEAADGLFGPTLLTSVSRLERYAECPFAHFVRYGLRPEPRQRYEVQAVDMGSLFHRVMEGFAEGMLAAKRDWASVTEEECRAEAGRIVDAITPTVLGGVFESTYRYRHLAGRVKRIAGKAIWMAARQLHQGDFAPVAVEQTFGTRSEDTYPPIEVILPDGRNVYLTGRIDRLDAWTDESGTEHLRVIDYKSGPKDWALYQVLYGVNLQLMVYMNAVLRERENSGRKARPAAALYFSIDDPIIQSDGQIVEEIERQIRRKFRMDGLVIRDAAIVTAMDRDQEDPTVLTARLKKDGDFYAGSHVADHDEYALVLGYVMDKAADLSAQLMEGNIGIAPTRERKHTACAFCEYGSICRFDPTIATEQFRRLRPLADGECLRRMKEERHA